jgi:hypothetical protein
MGKVKVLLFAANPQGTVPLDLPREFREIEEEIRLGAFHDAVELILVPGTRPVDLLRKLNENQPQIVHFSSHGTPAAILLESGEAERNAAGVPDADARSTDARNMKVVKPDVDSSGDPSNPHPHQLSKIALVNVLRSCDEGNLRLVVLNACDSRSQAEVLTEVVDCVVTMNRIITDRAAIKFAASFYGALAFGRSLRKAFDQGVARLTAEGVAEAETPELLVRAGVDASRLVLISPPVALSAQATQTPSRRRCSSLQETSLPSDGEGTEARSGSAITLRVPSFHCGSIVPLEFFIDREKELDQAKAFIESRQSFLLVGRRRAGKTSFGQKLMEALKADGATGRGRVFGCSIDLQQYKELDESSFLANTLLNLIGDVARKAFPCKSTTLMSKNPYGEHPSLGQDEAFKNLLALNSAVVARTHIRGRNVPPKLRTDEFERFLADLIEIVRKKGWADLFIFYDEANRLPLDLSERYLRWNVEALNRAEVVSIYAAGPELVDRFRDWSDREIQIGPFMKVEDMLRLLSRYYFGEISLRDDLPVAAEGVLLMWELSHGVPYQIQHLANECFARASADRTGRVEQRHVIDAHRSLLNSRPELFLE